MTLIANVMDSIASFTNKIANWLTWPAVPWNKFEGYWNELTDKIAPWNKIFPLTDLMVILGIGIAISVALMILYTVVLIKSFIPFSGGK